jgi:hypothetical protein
MKFKLRENNRDIKDDELLNDLKRVAKLLNKKSITQKEYNENGKFTHGTLCTRFGSWNNSLEKAGLKVSREMFIPNEILFENLERVWRTIGRQPTYTEMRKPLSDYSVSVYERRFGGWTKACIKFIKLKEGDLEFEKVVRENKPLLNKRYISEKKRLKVLKRDNYKCQKCGRSPATHRELFLHIDHIKPFTKGGDNSVENLQTLCNKCNLGKNNDETV